jgi:hypothetical protein
MKKYKALFILPSARCQLCAFIILAPANRLTLIRYAPIRKNMPRKSFNVNSDVEWLQRIKYRV